MKVYLIKEEDLDRLLAMIDRDPRHGRSGGSSQSITTEEGRAYNEAHGFFNYQVRTWVESVKR